MNILYLTLILFSHVLQYYPSEIRCFFLCMLIQRNGVMYETYIFIKVEVAVLSLTGEMGQKLPKSVFICINSLNHSI